MNKTAETLTASEAEEIGRAIFAALQNIDARLSTTGPWLVVEDSGETVVYTWRGRKNNQELYRGESLARGLDFLLRWYAE